MPRRGFIPKREVLSDPIYNSVVVTKLINQVMLDGKQVAEAPLVAMQEVERAGFFKRLWHSLLLWWKSV